MKSILLVISVLFAMNVFSQDKYLSVIQPGSEKETVFKENTRVRIKTVQGGKLKGRLNFVDETQVMIKNITLPLNSIAQIKHDPLLLNVFISGILIAGGGLWVLVGIAGLGWIEVPVALGIAVSGAGIMFAGILSPNFLPSVKVNKNASIKTVNVMQ